MTPDEWRALVAQHDRAERQRCWRLLGVTVACWLLVAGLVWALVGIMG